MSCIWRISFTVTGCTGTATGVPPYTGERDRRRRLLTRRHIRQPTASRPDGPPARGFASPDRLRQLREGLGRGPAAGRAEPRRSLIADRRKPGRSNPQPHLPILRKCCVTGVGPGVFAPGQLVELTQIVPFEMVDGVLAECGATQRRLRKLPARWWSTCCWRPRYLRSVAIRPCGPSSPPRWVLCPCRESPRLGCSTPAPGSEYARCAPYSTYCGARRPRSAPLGPAGLACWWSRSTAPAWTTAWPPPCSIPADIPRSSWSSSSTRGGRRLCDLLRCLISQATGCPSHGSVQPSPGWAGRRQQRRERTRQPRRSHN